MIQLQSKLPNVGTTIFTVMSALAREHNAINLSQGFPDFYPDQKLLDLAAHYMNSGFNQYSPMQGVLPLRERITEILQTCYKATYNADTEITVTAGATYGLYTCFAAFIHKGDEVIFFEPAYDCYSPAIEVHNGVAVPIEMEYPGFTINWNTVKQKITARTRMIVINSPQNPSGTTLTPNDLKELESIVKGKNIIVVSDEVYEHMAFDNKPHQSVALYPGLREFCVSVSGNNGMN